jgi:putative transposase
LELTSTGLTISLFTEKKLWGNHFWQRGYFVDSVDANEEIIRRYVRHQDKQEKEEAERQLSLNVE